MLTPETLTQVYALRLEIADEAPETINARLASVALDYLEEFPEASPYNVASALVRAWNEDEDSTHIEQPALLDAIEKAQDEEDEANLSTSPYSDRERFGSD